MAAAVVVAGCGSTVSGTSVAPSDQHNADDVTLDLLDPGTYPITAVPLAIAPSTGTGVVLEGQRMADAVVVPSEVDATLRRLRVSNTGVVENAQALRADIGLSRANIVAKHHFIAGFSSSRHTGSEPAPETSLVNLVMRFPDGGAAVAAAAELAATDVTQRPTPIPRHRAAAASAFNMAQGAVVESFTPRGPYLLYQWVQTVKPVETATELIAKTLDLQGPRVDQFLPTDPSMLAALPVDPSGLLAHTLSASPHAVTPDIGVYTPRAALHFQADPVDSAALFAATGVESVSIRDGTVFQAETATAAAHVAEQLTAREIDSGATLIQGVAGLPNARCVDGGMDSQRTSPRFRCYAAAGRHAFESSAEEQGDVRERTAAQYLILDRYHG